MASLCVPDDGAGPLFPSSIGVSIPRFRDAGAGWLLLAKGRTVETPQVRRYVLEDDERAIGWNAQPALHRLACRFGQARCVLARDSSDALDLYVASGIG